MKPMLQEGNKSNYW